MSLGTRCGLTLIAVAALQACGGGGGNDTVAATPPATDGAVEPATPSGSSVPAIIVAGKVVLVSTVSKATVCVDLNANSTCDSGEPNAANTDANGGYTIAYQPADTAAANAFDAAQILALIRTDSVDADDALSTATTSPYYMSAPASRKTQINPLTHMLQVGVKAGMTLAQAEAAVGLQFGIDPTTIATYYLTITTGLSDNTTTASALVADALGNLHAPLSVVALTDAPVPIAGQISTLNYTDAQNYFLRLRNSTGAVDGLGRIYIFETRSGRQAGAAYDPAVLTPVYLRSDGFVACDQTVPLYVTRGTASRSEFCGGAAPAFAYIVSNVDVSGRAMADVVAEMIAAGGSSIIMPPAALGSAVFPSGSLLRTNRNANLNQPWYINNISTDYVAAGTLEALIASRPAAGVNLGNAGGTLGLGTLDSTHTLRVAYLDSSTAQLYRCEATSPNYTDSHNCVATGTSAMTLTSVTSTSRTLTYAGLPNASFQRRGHGQYEGDVYLMRASLQDEATNLTYTRRLNDTASIALRTALGI